MTFFYFSGLGETQEDGFDQCSTPVLIPNSPAISSLQPILKIHKIASSDAITENIKEDKLDFLQKIVTEHLGNASNFFQFAWGTIKIFTQDHGILSLGITNFTKLQRSLYQNEVYTKEQLLDKLHNYKMTFNVDDFVSILMAMDQVFKFQFLDIKAKFMVHKCLLVILWWLQFDQLNHHLKRLQKVLGKKHTIDFDTVSDAMKINMRANNARWKKNI